MVKLTVASEDPCIKPEIVEACCVESFSLGLRHHLPRFREPSVRFPLEAFDEFRVLFRDVHGFLGVLLQIE
jgi:hypothetical protein